MCNFSPVLKHHAFASKINEDRGEKGKEKGTFFVKNNDLCFFLFSQVGNYEIFFTPLAKTFYS